MPKTTSTPTASRERTRLCAPVMPEAGSGAEASGERAAVSTPVSDSAASRVADPLGVVVLIASVLLAAGWTERAIAGGTTKNPSCLWHGGASASVGETGALGNYEEAGAAHLLTVLPGAPARQPDRPTVWTVTASFVGEPVGAGSRRLGSKPSMTLRRSSGPAGRPS